jgi:hypothetical protein
MVHGGFVLTIDTSMHSNKKASFPIFDELMDELEKAKWFTSLDLNARYHQVRLKLGE